MFDYICTQSERQELDGSNPNIVSLKSYFAFCQFKKLDFKLNGLSQNIKKKSIISNN